MKIKHLIPVLILLFAIVLPAGTALAQDDDMMSYTVMLSGNEELGNFFVGADGMTLYVFANDTAGVSNCVDACADNWPPLTLAEGENPSLDPAISGQVGVITRADGSRQVTYNGMPLYYWINDEVPGDTTGHNANDVWFVATMPMLGLGANDDLGDFLVGANGMTLYTFANDADGMSNCVDACADNWPPLTVDSEDALITQPGLTGNFSVIERADSSLQVTVDGMPLYFWINDEVPGDASGHNVNDVWFVAKLATVSVAESEEHGSILVGANGMTLYTFANDTDEMSNCVDACAVNWPPLTLVAGEEIATGDGIDGEFATIERADGSLQVTYNGMPLYFWIRDVIPGDTTGHNVNDVWFVAQP